MLNALITVLAPVFITAGVGYAWARTRLDFDTLLISRLVMNIGSPALVFSGLTKIDANGSEFGTLAIAALTTLVFILGANVAVVRALGLPLRDYVHPITFPNWGNLGLPLCLFAFGDAGLSYAIAFFVVASVVQFTVGVMIAAGEFKPGFILRMPMIYAVLIALVFLVAGITPPKWLLNTTDLLGSMMIPLMLLSLGVSLAELKLTRLREMLGFAIYRYLLGVGLGFAVASLFGLEGAARGVVVIQCSMPVAVFNYLLAVRFGGLKDHAASMVVLSTLISAAGLPLLLPFLL
ncbi:MAG: AEC family transporter [Alphaproteobacteria bacterium]|nr:MAG: AEC family transporter [Alphaproteobacteria bacterium]